MRIHDLRGGQYRLSFDAMAEDFFYDRESGRLAAEVLEYDVRSGSGFAILTGPSGCGKTHLLRGTAADFRAAHPGESARVVSAGVLAGELAAAFRAGTQTALTESRVRLGLLALDDVQELAGMPATQAELGAVIRRSLAAGGLVILGLDAWDERFLSLRQAVGTVSGSGICADMHLPGAACRRNFAVSFRAVRGLSVPDDVLMRLAAALPSVPLVRGALITYAAFGGGRTAEEITERITPFCSFQAAE